MSPRTEPKSLDFFLKEELADIIIGAAAADSEFERKRRVESLIDAAVDRIVGEARRVRSHAD